MRLRPSSADVGSCEDRIARREEDDENRGGDKERPQCKGKHLWTAKGACWYLGFVTEAEEEREGKILMEGGGNASNIPPRYGTAKKVAEENFSRS